MSTTNPKRQRIEPPPESSAPSVPTHSRILAPFRSIGHITSTSPPTIPFALLPKGKTYQLTTALTDTLQTYDIRKLNLLFVTSPPVPGTIRRVVAHKDIAYAAYEGDVSGVWVFKRGRKITELEGLNGGDGLGKWKALVVFGEWIVGAFDNSMAVWKRETGEVWTVMEMGAGGTIEAMVHPSAYLNKVVVARRGGAVEVWNVKTGKKIYTVLSPLPLPTVPTATTPIPTTLVQTPVISVIAIGYTTGEIHLHNIHTDTPLFTLNTLPPLAASQKRKRVTGLSFCTDPAVGAGKSADESQGGKILAVGDDDGDVTLWNLEKRKIVGVMRSVHEGCEVTVEWLVGQNVLVTSGGDNSVKEWIFDSPHTTLPRLLRSRAGHSQSITALTFLNATTSHFLLSSSQDRSLRALSLRNDAQSFEFSQGAAVKKSIKATKHSSTTTLADAIATTKAPPITAIATCTSEDGSGSTGREWEEIITAHRGETAARAWSYRNKKIGRWTLETTDGGEVKAVTISPCGTFAVLGSSKGGIDIYNLQSGLHRKRFPEPATAAQAKRIKAGETAGILGRLGKGKHSKAVTGVAVDALNRVLISTGLDGKIKFWDFNKGVLEHELPWATAITKTKLHRPSELLAVACDDLCIRIVDTQTRKIVRELWGAAGRISDFCWSNDGRWIIAASMDSVIRIWDLPTGHLVDGIRTKSIVTALAWSGTGEFLCTAHVDSVGVNLWTNRTLFTHVPTRHLREEDIVEISSPTASGMGGVGVVETAFYTDLEGENAQDGVYTTPEQLSEKILTMSLVPKTRWQTLLNLEVIRQRNKPKEAPKAPEKAPFFLPSLLGPNSSATPANTESALDPIKELQAVAERSRIMKMERNSSSSRFTSLLHEGVENNDYAAFITHLKTLPPSSADLEIRNLQNLKPYTELIAFVTAMVKVVETRKDWELALVWMRVFMKCHGEVVVEEGDGELRRVLWAWREGVKREQERVGGLVGYCAGVVGFLRSGR
ncbi:rRNA-processing protein utp21 [Rhizina undulata]